MARSDACERATTAVELIAEDEEGLHPAILAAHQAHPGSGQLGTSASPPATARCRARLRSPRQPAADLRSRPPSEPISTMLKL